LVRVDSVDRKLFESLGPDDQLPLKKKNSILKMAEIGAGRGNYDFCHDYNSRGRGRLTAGTQYTFGGPGEQAFKSKHKQNLTFFSFR